MQPRYLRLLPAILTASFVAVAGAGAVSAGPLEDALAAHERGDDATALRLMRPLADQGNAVAQYNLGFMYSNGLGVPRDYAEALKWYRRAANQGDDAGQNNVGNIYDRGLGLAQDYAEAIKWYRLAVARGNAKAQINLGFLYFQGYGLPQDFAEAIKCFQLAADRGGWCRTEQSRPDVCSGPRRYAEQCPGAHVVRFVGEARQPGSRQESRCGRTAHDRRRDRRGPEAGGGVEADALA